MKLFQYRHTDRLTEACKIRITQLQDAQIGEVEETLDLLLFMPCIKPYLEAYNAREGFSSLPSFGERGLDASIPGPPQNGTQEPIPEKRCVGRNTCSFAPVKETSRYKNTPGARDDAIDRYVRLPVDVTSPCRRDKCITKS